MKKTLLLYFFLCFLISKAQIPNPSFEDWGTWPFKLQGWNAYNEFHKAFSNAHNGNYALEIGLLTYTSAPNYIHNVQLTTGNLGNTFIPISTRPTKFFGWYGINGGSGTDTVAFIVKLKKSGNLIGVGQFTATSFQYTYTQFSTSIVYTSSEMPDSLSISLGFKTNINEYATCFIDDLSFDQTVGLNENRLLQPNIIAFPNPTQGKLTFTNYGISNNRIKEIEIQNFSGQLICKKLYEDKDKIELNTQDFENGLYFFKIRFEDGTCIVREVLKETP